MDYLLTTTKIDNWMSRLSSLSIILLWPNLTAVLIEVHYVLEGQEFHDLVSHLGVEHQ